VQDVLNDSLLYVRSNNSWYAFTLDDLDDTSTTNKFTTAAEISKLAGIEDGAEVNNISDADATDLTDGGATTLHKHDHGGMDGLADDDHPQYIRHALATAINDFLVASGAGAFVKKTLAETITILRTSLDSIFAPIAKGVTNGDSHDHNGGDGAQIDHGGLAGLGDDDHTIYQELSKFEGRHYLPFGVNDAFNPHTANGNPYAATIDQTMTLIKWSNGIYLLGTNNGSNYWTINLVTLFGTTVATMNTSALSGGTGHLISTTSFSPSSVGTSDVILYMSCVKTGSPGGLYVYGPALQVSI
jgi:hypothetical protein